MPKLACNGFSMFAAHCRPGLEATRGRAFGGMEELIEAANPLWSGLGESEKREWKERAKEYKKTEEYYERKRAFRRRGPAKSRSTAQDQAVDADDEDQDDYDSDFDPGVPMVRGPLPAPTVAPNSLPAPSSAQEVRLDRKQAADKRRVSAFLAGCSDVEAVKRVRWLQVSVQSYGPECRLPAEVALVEWSLGRGIMEEYFRIVGGWSPPSGEATAATKWAEEGHGIGLSGVGADVGEWTMSRRSVLRNVLGRTEPGIAVEQGVGVGLYASGLGEAGGSEVLPGDSSGRRWVLVLRSELEEVLESLGRLKEETEMKYEGLPVTEDRYVLAEAVLEALSERASGVLEAGRASSFLQPLYSQTTGPGAWEQAAGIFCSFHAPARNRHCAIAQARSTVFAAFALLKNLYGLPFNF